MRRLFKIFLINIILITSFSGCVYDDSPTPPRKNISQYKVQRGETLYSISWRYNLDHKLLAWWNKIPPPFTIYPGQRIYLSPPRGISYYPPRPQVAVVQRPPQQQTYPPRKPTVQRLPTDIPDVHLPSTNRPTQKPAPTQSQKAPVKKSQKPAATPWVGVKDIRWKWPTQGRVVRRFSESQGGKQGIDIRGRPGQTVTATASGKIVYSGNGLKGYGELVIIKHNETFLSAYAHNRKRTVKEGTIVNAGQKIAELGNTGASVPILHFEIRENGKPVDPLKYLPKK
ncbi:MAG TPA: LysM peptidoglycan-binding domain-containing protein [Chromatiales bacterium]|nr:LysM peptidoglycan-binding domain-containing protein [Thiotrichales bacterium]HIP67679.1 LysM peptidoglycan-binding domain-containing protein [Chromatiales bacterium]